MSKRYGAICLALLGLAGPAVTRSQSTATLEGVVRDEAGALAGARVTALDRLTNERRRSVTDQRGFFRILDVSPGRYELSAAMIGRTPATRVLDLVAGGRAQVDLVLDRAPTVLATVRVRHDTNDPGAIERMSVSTTLRAPEIERLPLDTRNVMDLAATAPGIRTFQPISGHSLPAAGALRNERGINLYVDGVEMKNVNSGNIVGSPQSGTLLPIDGVQEFRVLLDPYDAEFTRGAAYVVSAITKRGTNQRHGSMFGFFQNRDLISVNDFQRRIPNFAKPDVEREQSGASFSGPLVRDRLFYAASYELSNAHDYLAVVPGRPASDPGHWDNYAGVFDAPTRNHAALLHLTYVPSEAHAFEVIGSSRWLTGETGFGGTTARQSAIRQRYVVNTMNLRHRWLPTPAIANELSFQVVRWASAEHPVIDGPTFNYPTLTIGHGDATFEIHELQLRAVERLTYALGNGPGSHLLKVGASLARITAEQFAPTNGRGVFRFSSETGNPDQATIAVGVNDPRSDRDARSTLPGWTLGGYLNDEWHVLPRLVLNVGLRYDADVNAMNNRFTVPWAADTSVASRPELRGLLNRGDRRDDLDNFSPRLSFSWDATGTRRAFLRGGFGIMYDRVPGFVPFAERQTATWRTYTFANPNTLDPDSLRERVIAGGGTAVPPSITLLPHRMDAPENRQWSLGIGARLGDGVTLNLDYLDQRVRHLYAPVNLNWLDLSQSPARRALSSRYGNIVAWGDFARARYRALLTSVSYARDSTVHLTLSHTLGSARADWDVQTLAVPAKVASRYYTMQRTSGDERHRIVLAGSWQLRYGIGLSTIATAASPRPYRTTVGQDLNKDNTVDDDWIGGVRYRVPSAAWRNWYRVLDLRLVKTVGVVRGGRLLLVAEAFNVLNSQNYASYFGAERSTTGALRPDFGSPSATFATRHLQVGSRVQF